MIILLLTFFAPLPTTPEVMVPVRVGVTRAEVEACVKPYKATYQVVWEFDQYWVIKVRCKCRETLKRLDYIRIEEKPSEREAFTR